jgi:hypothetical protein
MKDSVHLTWKEGMAFEAKVDGFNLTIDAKKEHGVQDQDRAQNL